MHVKYRDSQTVVFSMAGPVDKRQVVIASPGANARIGSTTRPTRLTLLPPPLSGRSGVPQPRHPVDYDSERHPARLVTAIQTVIAMVAFAANSVLCRLALGDSEIDAATFTSVRILSGAITLVLLLCLSGERSTRWFRGGWLSPVLLATYAAAFSFAYLSLSTGTGALIMFGSVQLTMILLALRSGERPSRLEWFGLILAFFGLVYLVSPGITAPPLKGALLMAISGISWGFYTVRGRGGINPMAATAGNFIRAVPLVFVVSVIAIATGSMAITPAGLILAVFSGSLASGCGYVVWYAALRHLNSTRAAVVQLSVPLIAAAGGVLFISEVFSLRLIVSSGLILGGVGMAIGGRRRPG